MNNVRIAIKRTQELYPFEYEENPGLDEEGNFYPFPFAVKIKEVWEYARGTAPRPADMEETIQLLCDITWRSIGSPDYEIPSSWYNEPLGFMVRLAKAREKIDNENDLRTDELAALTGLSVAWIKRMCQKGEIKAKQNSAGRREWTIPAAEAKLFIKNI